MTTHPFGPDTIEGALRDIMDEQETALAYCDAALREPDPDRLAVFMARTRRSIARAGRMTAHMHEAATPEPAAEPEPAPPERMASGLLYVGGSRDGKRLELTMRPGERLWHGEKGSEGYLARTGPNEMLEVPDPDITLLGYYEASDDLSVAVWHPIDRTPNSMRS